MRTVKTTDRVELYLSDPEFFKAHLRGKLTARNIAMSAEYLETRDTLKEVGARYGVRQERVRQIYAYFLRRVMNIARKAKMKERAGYILFQGSPDEYFYKIKEKYSPKHADIALAYLLDKKTTSEIAKLYEVSDATVYGVVSNAIKYIEELNKVPKERVDERPLPDDTTMRRGIPLRQEEFNFIKDMFFRGEELPDVIKASKRSFNTCKFVKQAKDLEDYFRISREFSRKYNGGNKEMPAPPIPPEVSGFLPPPPVKGKNKYLDALMEIRAKLDEVMIQFITEEVRLKAGKVAFEDDLRQKLENI